MRGIIQFHQRPRFGSLELGEEPLVIGGRAGAIRVRGATVSRQQARIFLHDGRFWVEDLGALGVSVNGTVFE